MINGIHCLLYSTDADATRAFCRDVLGFSSVNAGDGWLIFALPPAELGIHPADESAPAQLYLMCDDVEHTVSELRDKGVPCEAISDQGWGLVTTIEAPGNVRLGLYQPRHPTALALAAQDAAKYTEPD
jgi:hypothetical protein